MRTILQKRSACGPKSALRTSTAAVLVAPLYICQEETEKISPEDSIFVKKIQERSVKRAPAQSRRDKTDQPRGLPSQSRKTRKNSQEDSSSVKEDKVYQPQGLQLSQGDKEISVKGTPSLSSDWTEQVEKEDSSEDNTSVEEIHKQVLSSEAEEAELAKIDQHEWPPL